MSSNKQLLPIEISTDEKINRIIKNTCLMLYDRKLIKHENIMKVIEKLQSTESPDYIYYVHLDNEYHGCTKIVFKLLLQSVSTINKDHTINLFLQENKDAYKILIFTEIANKASKYLYINYTNIEIFLERELLINIVSHNIVNKHIVLSKEEGNQVLKEYDASKKTMPKIFITDPIARYYNMQLNDICKILRSSKTTCTSVMYRIVVIDT